MSPWTALLESLHSSLIDEITERHPEPKPELGMPRRLNQWGEPATEVTSILISEVAIGDQRGLAALALEPGFEKALKIEAKDLWKSLLRRAGAEFMRRQVKPIVSEPQLLDEPYPLPKGYSEPGRLIWIPFRVGKSACYLGIGA
jgi:hypothetical protein